MYMNNTNNAIIPNNASPVIAGCAICFAISTPSNIQNLEAV